MTRFHINGETGNPGPCSASKRPCPHGGPQNHFDSMEAAQTAYESRQPSSFANPVVINGYERPNLAYVGTPTAGGLAEVTFKPAEPLPREELMSPLEERRAIAVVRNAFGLKEAQKFENDLIEGNEKEVAHMLGDLREYATYSSYEDAGTTMEEMDKVADKVQQRIKASPRNQAIEASVNAKMAENDNIERAVGELNSLADDLEGSVPDPEEYRFAADSLADFAHDEHSHAEVMELAQEWADEGNPYEMLVGMEFLNNVKRGAARGAQLK